MGFEIHAFFTTGQRVVLFERLFPAFDQPIKFYGTAYVRSNTKTELARCRKGARTVEPAGWTGAPRCREQATLADLDPGSHCQNPHRICDQNPRQADALATWDDTTF